MNIESVRDIWAVVLVPTAAAIAAVLGFAKTYLEKQQLQLEIARLQDEALSRNARVHQPTSDEVAKYGAPRPASRHRSVIVGAAAICLGLTAAAVSIGTRLSSSAVDAKELRTSIAETRRLAAEANDRLNRTELQVQATRLASLQQSRSIERQLTALAVRPINASDDRLVKSVGLLRGQVAQLALKQAEVTATVSEMAEQMTVATSDAGATLKEQLEYLEKIGPYLEELNNEIDVLKKQNETIQQKLEQLERQKCPAQ